MSSKKETLIILLEGLINAVEEGDKNKFKDIKKQAISLAKDFHPSASLDTKEETLIDGIINSLTYYHIPGFQKEKPELLKRAKRFLETLKKERG